MLGASSVYSKNDIRNEEVVRSETTFVSQMNQIHNLIEAIKTKTKLISIERKTETANYPVETDVPNTELNQSLENVIERLQDLKDSIIY